MSSQSTSSQREASASFLYQYRRVLDAKGLGYLKALLDYGAMKFSRPDEFNDPFDCYPSLWDDAPGVAGLPHAVLDNTNRTYQSAISALHGIACFTPHADSMLMWSHYGDQHRSVCVGFDAKELARGSTTETAGVRFLGPEKVSYSRTRPRGDDISMYTTKSMDWSYEDEYRLFSTRADDTSNGGPGVWRVPPSAIREVVAGARMSEETIARVVEIVGGRFPIKVAVLHRTDYKLVIEDLAGQPITKPGSGYVRRPDGRWLRCQPPNDRSS